jgi:ATP-dependent protease ClpP protease subunit
MRTVLNEDNEPNENASQQGENISSFGSALANSGAGEINVLTVIGQVEGHQVLHESAKTTKYEHVMPLIAAVEESSEIKALLVLLNTVGGDVEAGLGIAELIAGMKKPTASIVLGGSHSIGVPLAVAAKRSFIAPSGAMTIHPVRMNGIVIAVPQSFKYFERMQERVVSFVVEHSNITRKRFTEFMMRTSELANDVGSIIDAKEAVSSGLVDQMGTLSDALDFLHEEIKKNESKK